MLVRHRLIFVKALLESALLIFREDLFCLRIPKVSGHVDFSLALT